MASGEFRMANLPESTAGASVPIRNSEFDSRRSIEVSAGLIFRAGQLLITQRPAGGHLAGLWEFPGGKREPGESFEECLRRELHEELGVVVRVHEELERITHDYPEKSVHLRFFRCTLAEPDSGPRAIGCAAWKWVSPHELDDYAFPKANHKIIAMLTEHESASPNR